MNLRNPVWNPVASTMGWRPLRNIVTTPIRPCVISDPVSPAPRRERCSGVKPKPACRRSKALRHPHRRESSFNPNSEVENERRCGLWGAYASGVWFFGVAPETSSHKFFPAGNSRKCVSRKFGRDARTHTRDACAPHSHFGVWVKTYSVGKIPSSHDSIGCPILFTQPRDLGGVFMANSSHTYQ